MFLPDKISLSLLPEAQEMAKTHADRPALTAALVWDLIIQGKLDIKAIGGTVIFHLKRGQHVYQRWLVREKGKIIWRNATTYLRKGIFLVPIWKVVPNWLINFLSERGISLTKEVIVARGENHQRLIYMQVDDVDHVIRQAEHTIDGYLGTAEIIAADFPELLEKLNDKSESIVFRIAERKISAEEMKSHLAIQLRITSTRLSSILSYAPIFTATSDDTQTPANGLRIYANKLSEVTFRPVFFRLGYASRKLLSAAKDIEEWELYEAKKKIASAIRSIDKTVASL